MPNFWRTGAHCILKIQWFPLSILIFGQKSCFLGPTIFKIPQPNWYCNRPIKFWQMMFRCSFCVFLILLLLYSLPLTKTALFLLSSDFALNLEGSKSGKIPASRRFLDDGWLVDFCGVTVSSTFLNLMQIKIFCFKVQIIWKLSLGEI